MNIYYNIMASTKRDSRDISKFAGRVVGDIYTFPTLYNRDTKGRIHIWKLYVNLVKGNGGSYLHNWEDVDEVVPLTKKTMYEHGNSKKLGYVGRVWTEQGIENMVISKYIPTIITSGKNIGKVNETSMFEQAVIVANGLYEKKVDKGGTPDRKLLSQEFTSESRRAPMALHKYKDFGHKYIVPYIKDGIYVQPKLDGVRAIAHNVGGEVDLYSRGNKNYNHLMTIIGALKPLLVEYPTMFIDGEIYGKGLSLQEISGIRGEKCTYLDEIKYNIFDIFFSDEPDMPFSERYKHMKALFKNDIKKSVKLTMVETCKINKLEDIDKYYKLKLVEGYEGIVLRVPDGIYETDLRHFKERRSYKTLKYKPRESSEFKIIGYASGTNGKELGAIKFIVEIPTKSGNKELTVTPNMPIDKRYEMYKSAKKDFNVFKGKMATIEYDKISDGGIPLYSKMIAIRDYE